MVRLLCLLMFAAATGSLAVAQPDPAPYLYYFSPERHAFVVERADGTDSRLFGQGVIPINAVRADGVWSPSGQYFAWHTTRPWIEYVDPRQTNEAAERYGILRADGTPLPDMLPQGEFYRPQYAWSPVEDLLFAAVGRWAQPAGTFKLIDPHAESVLAELALGADPDGIVTPPVWTSNGEAVVVLHSYVAPDPDAPRTNRWYTRLYRFDRTGEIRDVLIECFDNCIETHPKPPAVSPRGEYLLLDPANGEPALYNLTTGTYTPVAGGSDVEAPRVFWSPDGAYALLATYETTWLFDRAQLRISELSDGTSGFLIEDLVPDPELWSPDGRFVTWNDNHGTLYIWELITEESLEYAIPNANTGVWSSDSHLLLVPVEGPRDAITIIDAVSGGIVALPVPTTLYIRRAWPSPDGRYWGLNTVTSAESELVDLDTGHLEVYREHAIAHVTPPPALIDFDWEWSDDGSWFISTHYAFWAGGGGSGPLAVVVFRVGDIDGRDIGYDSGQAVWLPDAAAQALGLP